VTQTLTLGHDQLTATLTVSDDGRVHLTHLAATGASVALSPDQPLVEILTVEDGHAHASERLIRTAVGERLRYVGHADSGDADAEALTVELADTVSGLTAAVRLATRKGVGALTVSSTVTNSGAGVRTLRAVTSMMLRVGTAAEPVDLAEIDLVRGTSEWLSESRWRRTPARDSLRDLNGDIHGQDARGRVSAVSLGSWSTGGDLPVAAAVHQRGEFALLWQVEHNGGWRWEVGEQKDGFGIATSGPTDLDHQWLLPLAPGESFTTVAATLAVGNDLDSALAELTDHRRRVRRAHLDNERQHLVFNDFMNTLMGDPTTAKLLPLIDAAAQAGAEVFCIDAGWYDDGGSWWPSVGAWEPSTVRFPNGLSEVIDHITGSGMIAGLWLEPEVIGVNSPVVDLLPDDAFLVRNGVRVAEAQRFHLDLSHPAARAHLDAVVDRLVGDFGVGFFKMDYNINPGPGSDRGGVSAGVGLLRHNRAQLDWLDAVLDRHPQLIIENCSSGAMRMDPAILARLQLQSTSDQQDPIRYPTIAAAAPMSMLPEQAGNWAYPNVDMDAETTAFSLVAGITGRLYLSGYLNRLRPEQTDLVGEAIRVHKQVRSDIVVSYASWPLDLPGWDDPVVALALHAPAATYLSVWQREDAPTSVSLSLPALAGEDVDVETIFPATARPWLTSWDPASALLTLDFTTASPAARVLKIVSASTPD